MRSPAGRRAPDQRIPLYDSGLRYEDLVAAGDVVVTKPGYGIVAECIANDTAVLYTSRWTFRGVRRDRGGHAEDLRCGFIDQDDLLAGRWRSPLDRIMASPPPPEHPSTNGANVIAEMIDRRTPASRN